MSFFKYFGGEGSTDKDSSLIDKLKAIGGSSERSSSGVNITETAKRLKVNPRTVRGWLNEGKHPSPKSSKRVTTLARNAERTKAGRRAAVERAKQRGMFTGVSQVSITGLQGPSRSGRDYARERTITLDPTDGFTPADIESMQEAYINGGDTGVQDEIRDVTHRVYLNGWGVESYGDKKGSPWLEWE